MISSWSGLECFEINQLEREEGERGRVTYTSTIASYIIGDVHVHVGVKLLFFIIFCSFFTPSLPPLPHVRVSSNLFYIESHVGVFREHS